MTRPAVRLTQTHPGFAGVLRAFVVLHVGLGVALTFGPDYWFAASGYDTHRDVVTTVVDLATPMRAWGLLFLTAGLALAVGYRLDVPSGTAERVLGPGLAFASFVLLVWDMPFLIRAFTGVTTGITAPIAYTAFLIIHGEALREPFRNPLRDATFDAGRLLVDTGEWGTSGWDDGGADA